MPIIYKKDLDEVRSVFSRQNSILIEQNDRIIGQNDRIIELLEKIAGEEGKVGKVKFAETGEKICPHCNRMNRPENTYCQNCGTQI